MKHGIRSLLKTAMDSGKARSVTRLDKPVADKRSWLGWVGLAVGLTSVTLALIPAWIAPLYDPPSRPIPQRATDWLGEIKDQAIAAIKLESTPPPPPEIKNAWRDPRIGVTSLLLGFSALACGILAFVRHEEQRLVACAVALGAGAIAAQHILTAALILAFAVLVGVVLARFG